MHIIDNFHVCRADRDTVTFAWDGPCGFYVLQGVVDDLSFQTLGTFDCSPACVGRRFAELFHGFRVSAIHPGGDMSSSGVILRRDVLPEAINIEMSFLSGYDGSVFTVLGHDGMCDEYAIYDCTDGGRLVAASEDFVLAVSGISAGHAYMAVGMRSRDGMMVPVAWSPDTAFVPAVPLVPGSDGPDLTVIMPVFNTARYLPRAVASVLGSFGVSIELLLVDDGSTDGSLDICSWYERAYQNVRVMRMDRGGPSGARNAGVDAAGGRYVSFIDSDDIVHPFAYRSLLSASADTGDDIAIMGTVVRDGFGQRHYVLDPFRSDVSDGPIHMDLDEMMFPTKGRRYFFCSSCNKIVRTSIAKKVRAPEHDDFVGGIMSYEDIAYTPALYSYANGFSFVHGVCYVWEKRHKVLLDAQSYYYPSSGIWKEVPFMSFMAAVWSRLFSSRNCDPVHRAAIDGHVLNDIRTLWDAWAEKYSDYNGFYLIRDFTLRSVHAADVTYGYASNPYVVADSKSLAFLAVAAAYSCDSGIFVVWRGTRMADFDMFADSNPLFEYWLAKDPVSAGTVHIDVSRYSRRQRSILFRRFSSGDTMVVCRSLVQHKSSLSACASHAHAGSTLVTVRADGAQYTGFASDRCIMRHMRMTGHVWASDSIDAFMCLSRRFYDVEPGTSGLFCDIGANIGTTCIHFRRNIDPGVRVLAFEPMRDIYDCLVTNASMNGLGPDEFTAVNAGVSDKCGQASMAFCTANPGGSSIASDGEAVATVRFDDYIHESGIDVADIKYVWVDIEGFEGAFLSGAMNTLSRIDVPVVVEFTPKYLAKFGHARQFIDSVESLYSYYVVVSDPGMTVYPVSRLRRYFNADFSHKEHVQFDIFLLKHGRV